MKPIALLLGAVACAAASPALAADDGTTQTAAADLAPSGWMWTDDGGSGPLSIVISLADQRAYVYRDGARIAESDISTGRDGKETPIGAFPILEKEVRHRSNRYDSAPMPYMERLTWGGVAIHAGTTPGYRTSHGCIHVPLGFAKKLYAATEIGTLVEITDQPAAEDDGEWLDESYGEALGGTEDDAGRIAAE
ncbi:MAG TPA: L,D-transpeptidase family protein [Sphingomonas sp.]|nr:L,D-transpeptidase family protein [Sphingomonas sp.]